MHPALPRLRAAHQTDRAARSQSREPTVSRFASVPLNVSESDGQRGGNRLQRRLTALGSARETGSCLEIAEAVGYIGALDPAVANRVNHVIGALVLMTR